MGTKKTIGFYFYNPNRPTWAINLGGILQGLSFFFGLCGLGAFGMGFSFPPAFIGFAVFAALTIVCQLVGRRLSLGKKPKPSSKTQQKADPAMVELVAKLRERGVSDEDIVEAVRAVQNGEPAEKVIKQLKTKAGKK